MAMNEHEIKAQGEATKAGYKHVEAFRLMMYHDEKDPTFFEVIWNSRDGVTPFIVRSKDGTRRLQHSSRWRDEPCVPSLTPQIGARVFVDLTLERSREKAKSFITSLKEAAASGNKEAQAQLNNVEQACIEEIMYVNHHPEAHSPEQLADPFYVYSGWIERRAADIRPGEPDLIEVDQAFLDRLAELRKVERKTPLFEGPITITALVIKALDNSKKKGFFPLTESGEIASVNVTEKLCMIHSEISEALEVFRARESEDLTHRWKDEKGKPCGFGSELADNIIRTAGLAGALGIDLEREIREKMEYNLTRPFQHGKKYGEK